MNATTRAAGAQQKRLVSCLDSLAEAAGHAGRRVPLQSCCAGLLLSGERKSVEPMAARLAPDNVCRTHQSLHHSAADAPWSEDKTRRRKAGVPEEVSFRTKPPIALARIRRARERGIPGGVILTGAGYGTDTRFRTELAEMGMPSVAGSMSSVSVWKPQQMPQPAKKWEGKGRPAKFLRRDPDHPPAALKELALSLPPGAWKAAAWRQGVKRKLRSRFAALRVRPAHRGYWRGFPHSIASLRRTIAGFLLRQLARCRFCGPLR